MRKEMPYRQSEKESGKLSEGKDFCNTGGHCRVCGTGIAW